MTTSSREYLSSLRRGLRVLAMFNQKTSVSITQVAHELALPRTTAKRLIETLVLDGYVARAAGSRQYRLTPAVLALAAGFSDESWVSHIASPLLFEETRRIGWPLSLATPLGEEMMVRVSTDRSTTLAIEHFHIGYTMPIMHSTAGHVLLAYLSAVHRAALLDLLRRSDDPRQADAHRPDMVRHILDKVRARGFEHLSFADYVEACIAVPLFADGQIVASLNLIYIKRAMTPQRAEAQFVPVLQALARRIEDELAASKVHMQTAAGDRGAGNMIRICAAPRTYGITAGVKFQPGPRCRSGEYRVWPLRGCDRLARPMPPGAGRARNFASSIDDFAGPRREGS